MPALEVFNPPPMEVRIALFNGALVGFQDRIASRTLRKDWTLAVVLDRHDIRGGLQFLLWRHAVSVYGVPASAQSCGNSNCTTTK